MAGFVALLRGVNLGARRVPMADLRALGTELGFAAVRTHANSGNLLFEADAPATRAGEKALAEQVHRALAERFRFDVPVVVRTATALRAALDATPYGDGDPKQVCITFCSEPLAVRDVEAALARLATEHERYVVRSREIHLDFAGGLARSKLAAGVPKASGDAVATTRNLSSVRAMCAVLEG